MNSHVEGHVVGDAIPVVIGDVMDGAHRQDNLTHRVNDGQVNNSPAEEDVEARMGGETSSTRPPFTRKVYFTAAANENYEKTAHLYFPSQESAMIAPRMGVR